jgi:hypothetical protein
MTRLNWDRAREHRLASHEPVKSGRAYIDERKPLTDRQRNLIRQLRVELGLTEVVLPKTNREGRALIDSLLKRKRAA